jgi:hypothetical protein
LLLVSIVKSLGFALVEWPYGTFNETSATLRVISSRVLPFPGSLIALSGVWSPLYSLEFSLSIELTFLLFLQHFTMQQIIAIKIKRAMKLAILTPTMKYVMPSGPMTNFSIQIYSSPTIEYLNEKELKKRFSRGLMTRIMPLLTSVEMTCPDL